MQFSFTQNIFSFSYLHFSDYTAEFPLCGPITYAKVLLLVDMIQNANLLHLDTALPVAVSLIDKISEPIAAKNLRRSCFRHLHAGKDLHQKIDHLYVSKDNSLGPFSMLNIKTCGQSTDKRRIQNKEAYTFSFNFIHPQTCQVLDYFQNKVAFQILFTFIHSQCWSVTFKKGHND